MSELDVPQAEADALFNMPKIRMDDAVRPYPERRASILLMSEDETERFTLTLTDAGVTVAVQKGAYQKLTRRSLVLCRLCYGRKRHRNPEGDEILGNHLHYYREGHGVKWAKELPSDRFPDGSGSIATIMSFMSYCNIVKPPMFQGVLR